LTKAHNAYILQGYKVNDENYSNKVGAGFAAIHPNSYVERDTGKGRISQT